MIKSLTILAAVAVFTGFLAGCGGPSPDAASSMSAASRGVADSPIPEAANNPNRLAAAEFVIAAATPDARLDPAPQHATTRATAHVTPELAQQITTADTTADVPGWWRRLLTTDGYVSIEISNIVGDEPQAAPPPGSPEPTITPGQEVQLDVMFTRTSHAVGRAPRQGVKTHIWIVTVRDGLVVAFEPDQSD